MGGGQQESDHGQLSQLCCALITSSVKWGNELAKVKHLGDFLVHSKDLIMVFCLFFLDLVGGLEATFTNLN